MDPDSEDARRLQGFLVQEQHKLQLQELISTITEQCFKKCVSTPAARLSNSESSCITNCAKRYIDTTQVLMEKFSQG